MIYLLGYEIFKNDIKKGFMVMFFDKKGGCINRDNSKKGVTEYIMMKGKTLY
jgi:hypothetical protein